MRKEKTDNNYSEKISALKEILNDLSENHEFSKTDFVSIVEEVEDTKEIKENFAIPLSIFSDDKLSSLEAITKYLREEFSLSFNEIADMLGRNFGPIGVTYRNSVKKSKKRLQVSFDTVIPIDIFSNTKFSALENLVHFLKENIGLNYSQIARKLCRDPRTIWTVYNRYQKKRGDK